MLTMLEKPAVATVTATLPTVTYDLESRQITATVIVSADGTFHSPVIAIPGRGTGELFPWTVNWKVLPDATLLSVVFDSDFGGLQIPLQGTSLPPLVTLGVAEPGLPADEFQITITNDVEGSNSIRYGIWVQGTPQLIPHVPEQELRFFHDPTIAVVPEPIG